MDDLGVPAAGAGADGAGGLDDDHFEAAVGEGAADCQADDAGADDDRVDGIPSGRA